MSSQPRAARGSALDEFGGGAAAAGARVARERLPSSKETLRRPAAGAPLNMRDSSSCCRSIASRKACTSKSNVGDAAGQVEAAADAAAGVLEPAAAAAGPDGAWRPLGTASPQLGTIGGGA